MKDEIREILQTLGGIASGDWIQMLPKEANKLLDYITNLQQDYDNEAEENLKLSEWLVEKQQRIEELEEINKQHQELNGELRGKINKAIEELKQAYINTENNNNTNYIHIAFRDDLLNILQGSE